MENHEKSTELCITGCVLSCASHSVSWAMRLTVCPELCISWCVLSCAPHGVYWAVHLMVCPELCTARCVLSCALRGVSWPPIIDVITPYISQAQHFSHLALWPFPETCFLGAIKFEHILWLTFFLPLSLLLILLSSCLYPFLSLSTSSESAVVIFSFSLS